MILTTNICRILANIISVASSMHKNNFSYARSVQQQQLLWKENSWVQIPQRDIPPAVIYKNF